MPCGAAATGMCCIDEETFTDYAGGIAAETQFITTETSAKRGHPGRFVLLVHSDADNSANCEVEMRPHIILWNELNLPMNMGGSGYTPGCIGGLV